MDQGMVFDLAWVGAVIGFFLPLVISFVKRAQWSPGAKKWLAVLTSVVVGLVNTGIQAGWDFSSVGQFFQLAVFSVTDIYVLAAVTYQNFWKDTAPETSLAAIGSS